MEEYPYEPYEFANVKEIERYIDKARGETVDSLYQKIKSISQKYNDQDEHKIVLLAADILWSFFQDKFSTTHYVAVIGDNGSGKSTYGDTFGVYWDRAINMTDPTAGEYFQSAWYDRARAINNNCQRAEENRPVIRDYELL